MAARDVEGPHVQTYVMRLEDDVAPGVWIRNSVLRVLARISNLISWSQPGPRYVDVHHQAWDIYGRAAGASSEAFSWILGAQT